jgi:hypothetical protein
MLAGRWSGLSLLTIIALAGCSTADCACRSGVDPGSGLRTVVDEQYGSSHLVVEAIGSPPLLLRKGVIRICGCELRITREGQEEPVHAEQHGEIEPDILIDHTDFSRGIVRITSFTKDPRQEDGSDVPLVRTCLTLGRDGRASIVRDVLLPPEEVDDAAVEKWIAEILALNAMQSDGEEQRLEIGQVIDRNLGHLRNAAVSRPEAILPRLRSLPPIAVDCSCQHMKQGYLEEVALLGRIRRERGKAGRIEVRWLAGKIPRPEPVSGTAVEARPCLPQ